MSLIDPKNLSFIRQIPVFGARLYESLQSIQQGINAMAIQGNLNPTGEILPPPAIQGVYATGANGVLHVSIQHTAADVSRNINYIIEHADNGSFINPQIRHIGDSRSFSEFVGNQSRWVRAYATYPGSAAGAVLYHGGATPQPVEAGGSIGPAPFLPSQGRSTGAPGQGGPDSSPVLLRSELNGFDWKAQQPTATGGFTQGDGSPGAQNAFGAVGGATPGGGGIPLSEGGIAACETLVSVAGTNTITAKTSVTYSSLSAGFAVRLIPANTNSGAVTLNVNGIGAKAVTKNGTTALSGGELQAGREYSLFYDGTRFQIIGPSFPVSATVLASDAATNPTAAALAQGKLWIGGAGNLPVAQTVSNDFTIADDGTGTLKTVNASPGVPGAFGDSANVAQVTVNAKGLVTAVADVPIAFPSAQAFTSVTLTPTAIASLPGTPTKGQMASVNNALAPVLGAAVAGTGTAFAAVCWNGSQWTVFSI